MENCPCEAFIIFPSSLLLFSANWRAVCSASPATFASASSRSTSSAAREETRRQREDYEAQLSAAAEELRTSFAQSYGGARNAGKPILKKKGMEYSELGAGTSDNRSAELAAQINSGKASPATQAYFQAAAAAAAKEKSPKERLEQEKERLEKNIARLTARLEHVEQSLASLS